MTANEQNQERIEKQMQTITAQARTIAEQAQRISDLYALLQKALEHAPVVTRNKVTARLAEMGMEPAGEVAQ